MGLAERYRAGNIKIALGAAIVAMFFASFIGMVTRAAVEANLQAYLSFYGRIVVGSLITALVVSGFTRHFGKKHIGWIGCLVVGIGCAMTYWGFQVPDVIYPYQFVWPPLAGLLIITLVFAQVDAIYWDEVIPDTRSETK